MPQNSFSKYCIKVTSVLGRYAFVYYYRRNTLEPGKHNFLGGGSS
jgi:hypothetical protein